MSGLCSKFCHNTNLKITNCTQKIDPERTLRLKTLWKLFNSTPKTGFGTTLFHFFNRVFNLWKKSGGFTKGITRKC